MPDGSRLPGWEKLKIGGPPISEQLERKKEERKFVLWEGTKVYLDGKGPRKRARRKLAGPAMMRVVQTTHGRGDGQGLGRRFLC